MHLCRHKLLATRPTYGDHLQLKLIPDEIAAGTVISQSPGAGQTADFESTVTITVAKLPGDPDPGAGDPNA